MRTHGEQLRMLGLARELADPVALAVQARLEADVAAEPQPPTQKSEQHTARLDGIVISVGGIASRAGKARPTSRIVAAPIAP